MLMITALSGTISGECLFYKENGGYQNEDIWKKKQLTGKRKEDIKPPVGISERSRENYQKAAEPSHDQKGVVQMLNFKEFQEYIKSNVKDYLPESYKDADIQFRDVVKNNDVHLTGVLIKKENETLTPNIYINELYEKYSSGMNLDEIVGDIADLRIEHDPPEEAQSIGSIFTNYEMVKQRLEIHLCDMELNRDKLKNQVYTEQGDFAATYHIKIGGDGMLRGSAAVTPNLLKNWGITLEQLREDSLQAEHSKGAVFMDIEELDAEKMFGLKSTNLLDKQNDVIDNEEGFSFYCLTSEEKIYGASMILQEDVIDKISKLMGGDFYILPSSIHETLIVPTTTQMTLEDMSIMVQYVNKEAVEPEDKLSDKVQFYDSKEMVIENAKKRESRLAMEKASTKEAGIHKKLQENRQKNMKVQSEGKRTSNRDLAAL